MLGGSIDRLLSEFGPFDEVVIVKYLKQVVMGVAYLHENLVIHRDLKGGDRWCCTRKLLFVLLLFLVCLLLLFASYLLFSVCL